MFQSRRFVTRNGCHVGDTFVGYSTCRHLLCTKSRGGACLVALLIGVYAVFLAIAVATLTKLDKMVAYYICVEEFVIPTVTLEMAIPLERE